MTTNTTIKEVDYFIENWKNKKGNLIMILHDMQDYYGYVPKEEAYKLSKALNIPLARIYEVITFYNYFNLTPPGKNKISVCMGTACYLKGAPDVIKQLSRDLEITPGTSTPDGLFHLELVRCLGCCGLAPVVMINDKVYSKVTSKTVKDILTIYKKEG
jgi:NADH-quinone oxidoreductase subunit E